MGGEAIWGERVGGGICGCPDPLCQRSLFPSGRGVAGIEAMGAVYALTTSLIFATRTAKGAAWKISGGGEATGLERTPFFVLSNIQDPFVLVQRLPIY